MSRVHHPDDIICDCGCGAVVTDTSELLTVVFDGQTYDFINWAHAAHACSTRATAMGQA